MPPEKFRVGLVQMSMTSDPDKNLGHAIDRVREAATLGAQIVCLPELFQTQYFCQREDASLFDLAEPIPGPTSDKTRGSGQATGHRSHRLAVREACGRRLSQHSRHVRRRRQPAGALSQDAHPR